jgi:asparagine synthase (glutamine-hydrolysing)
VLHLYEERGERCLDRLRGMFAFAIWDRRRQRLFAARDRFGQKPLFYSAPGDRFLFASEIKGLLAAGVPAEPEPAAIDCYLTFRFVPPPLTMLHDVRKLAAGHYLLWSRGELRVERWWELEFRQGTSRPVSDWLAELAERLRGAVESHLVSDVPVGALLSGGLDSSLVVALMAQARGASLSTFAIGSEVPSYDERPHARLVAAHCGTDHRERVVSSAVLADIPRLVRCLDEPSDPIAACFFESARLASEHVKVALGGDGGDELFVGFDRYVAWRWLDWYGRLPVAVREGVIRPVVERMRDSFAYKGMAQRARWLVEVGSEKGSSRYARMNSFFRFGPEERSRLYGPTLRAALKGHGAEEAITRPFEEGPATDTLHRMLHTDIVTKLPEHTLMLSDRLSMAQGLELRAPLLDHELAEFTAAMPAQLKLRHGTTKWAMRQVAGDLLPAEIVARPKQGFMFPVAHWLNEDTAGDHRASLLSGPLVGAGWIESTAIEGLFTEHLASRVDHHVRIWMLLNLEAWFRIYVLGEPVAERRDAPARETPDWGG